jgi:hypothetical protein
MCQLLRGMFVRPKVFWFSTSCCLLYHGVFCRSVVEPQRDLGAKASPSRTLLPGHKVASQTLADDARTATSPPAADSRMVTPPPAVDAGAHGSVGGVGA